ncbi:MAG: dihydrofolate reductase [Legionellaceae bacterium]|nr:dihydrofolate reductase [Legionellaceae bacterium]
MSRICLVVIVDEARGIGYQNKLLCHLPADLAHFKALTLGKTLIMGRRTYDSIGRPLPKRRSIVLSRHPILGVEQAFSWEEALRLAGAAPELMVIGGAHVYQQALPVATDIYMTKIHHHFVADTFFPVLEESEWDCQRLGVHEVDERNAFAMTFYHYEWKK